ncbi:MAG: hypothetical protein LAT66_03345 [Alkalimonas sp.]|nr:hypothetical protein [Alkalimonas sp.]
MIIIAVLLLPFRVEFTHSPWSIKELIQLSQLTGVDKSAPEFVLITSYGDPTFSGIMWRMEPTSKVIVQVTQEQDTTALLIDDDLPADVRVALFRFIHLQAKQYDWGRCRVIAEPGSVEQMLCTKEHQ